MKKLALFCLLFCSSWSCGPQLKEAATLDRTSVPLKGTCIVFSKLDLCGYLDETESLNAKGHLVTNQKFQVKLTLTKRDGSPLGAEFDRLRITPFAYLWMVMRDKAHGTSEKIETRPQVDRGHYELNNLYMTMADKWELHVQLRQDFVPFDYNPRELPPSDRGGKILDEAKFILIGQ